MPPDLMQRLTLIGGFIPGTISIVVLGLLWWMHKRKAAVPADEGEPAGDGPRWALPALLTLGFVLSDWVVKGSFDWWPTDATKRVTHAALLIGLAGVIEGAVRLPGWFATAMRAGAYGASTWMLCEGYAPQTISSTDLWGYVAAVGIVGALIAHASDRATETTPGWTGTLAWLALVGAVHPMFHLGGFSSGTMAMAGVVAVLTSALIVSVLVRDFRVSRGGVGVVTGLLIVGTLGAGVQTEPKNVPALLLVACSPMVMVLIGGGAKRTLLMRLAAIGVLSAAAGGLLLAHDAASDGEDANPYEQYYGG